MEAGAVGKMISGADSNKGDFLPCPTGGPLVRRLEGAGFLPFLHSFVCVIYPTVGREQDSHPLRQYIYGYCG